MSPQNLLQQLRGLNRYSPEFHDQLNNVLCVEKYKQLAQNLQDDDLVWLVDYLDEVLDILNPAGSTFWKCLSELRDICGAMMVLPTSYALSSSSLEIGRQPAASGGSGDNYEGSLNGSRVCVKRVRVYAKGDPKKAARALYQEAIIWKRLTHPSIVPLLGITSTPFQLISEWMPGGDLSEYVRTYPGVDRFGLLSGVAYGLRFLHCCDVAHGDLKGPNILVDATGHARLTGFSLATVTNNLDYTRSTPIEQGRTTRWTAPEILNEQGTYSKEADIFSFAMVIIEAFTGAVPFSDHRPAAAIFAIMGGKRPFRPIHPSFTDELWALTQRCWDQDPHLRPEVSEVFKVLGGLGPPSTEPMVSHPPPLYNAVSSPSPCTPQITHEESNHRGAPNTLSPGNTGVGVELDENKNMRPYEHPQATIQDPSLKQGGGQPNGHIDWTPPHWSIDTSEPPSPLPIDPQPFDFSEPHEGLTQRLIDAMDEALVNYAGSDKERLKLFNKLCKTCSRERLLPRSMHIPNRSWAPIGDDCYGGNATVSECTYKGRRVAVKVPYVYLTSDFDSILSRFCKEAVAWKHLQHPNILPLLGVTLAKPQFAMVSEWMEDGNINNFIQNNPGANRTKLLADVAKGLAYMHGLHLVHGDLKGANILINKDRRACISDFGLSTITGVMTHTGSLSSLLSNDTAMSFISGGTARWMSPELLDPERFGGGDRPTKQSDCYALGMVIYEVLCGHAPYHELSGNEMAMLVITEGVRPEKPENATQLGFTEELWSIVEQCWLGDWRARPASGTTGDLPYGYHCAIPGP